MTNPNNAVGTNAAYSGRTSVNAFNDDLAAYGRGILSGWACSPSTGLKVQLGGSGITRDVAVAVDNAGNHTTINNISGAPIEMTISAAPSTNSRIDAIVAYVDNPAEGVSTVADNPAACGMIVVKGTAAASPVEPNESTIRAAITADGASGVTAYYAVLATVKIASGTTDLTSANIFKGPSADQSEHFIMRHTGNGAFTLPAGYTIYHIQGGISYTTSSAASAIRMDTTNYTGTSWVRRIEEKPSGGGTTVAGEQFDFNDGRALSFGSTEALGNSSGVLVFDLTATRYNNKMFLLGNFHHGGANSSGLATSEVVLSDPTGDIPLEIKSTSPRTFSGGNFIITGV